ncbi:ABC-F family ATP-binding cassette domain-containing protein [Cyanobacterium sp. uoEpiScrs1]|uniref:ABC-F family ATP-binding cassette domain-containing protein n=1 Tax=Cyanobacterium sp. uoEpiScrs1 TaxID=2976343 RepID=UPI002269EBAB|nr:ABC-F family ATP-binding cassette domain-containing protein [Cyanobacterium sp. uoEpiScrs1]
MTIFTLRELKKSFGIKTILNNISFSLNEGDKVGLIGTNGSGKSTLLKIIAQLELADGGDIWVNTGAKIVYLPQQPDLDEQLTVLEQVFTNCGEQMKLVQEYERLSNQIAREPKEIDTLMAQLSTVSQRIDALGAWEVETNAKIILSRLGIEDFESKIADLSGGYRKRIALASALLSNPDVLLMDEPTNHLDVLSVEWLQSYLNHYQGALLLITHDRYFLDKVTHRILEIDQGDLHSYSGNYSYYLQKKVEDQVSQLSSQRKQAGILQRELEWLKRGPKARSTKQKARIDRIRDMQEVEYKQDQDKIDISTISRRIGKKVIELKEVNKSYGKRTLIKDFTYIFNPEDRVGIIGPNGAGKSTLMNIIMNQVTPDSGIVDIGATIHLGYFDQHSKDLIVNQNERVIDHLKSIAELVKTTDGNVITASQMLERFLFPPDQQYVPICKLSGGEKRRLFLLQVLMSSPNVLILDEPTNDFDVQTLAVLEEYLDKFNGCVIVVSHDRYFLDRTVGTIFSLESDGTISKYPGNYSIYLDYKRAKEEQEKEEDKKRKKQEVKTKKEKVYTLKKLSFSQPRKLSFSEKHEYKKLEEKISELEAKKENIEQILYDNPPSDFTKMQKLTKELAQLIESIEVATRRWLELAELDS